MDFITATQNPNKNHQDITSERKEFEQMGISFKDIALIPKDVLDEILDATKDIFNQIPAIKGVLTSFTVREMDEDIIAGASPYFEGKNLKFEISLNSKLWYDSKVLRNEIKDSFKRGFLATSTPKGTIYHEIGHVINGMIIFSIIKWEWLFLLDWNHNFTIHRVLANYNIFAKNISYISDYATQDSGEAYAEIFAAYYAGKKLSPKMQQMIKESIKF